MPVTLHARLVACWVAFRTIVAYRHHCLGAAWSKWNTLRTSARSENGCCVHRTLESNLAPSRKLRQRETTFEPRPVRGFLRDLDKDYMAALGSEWG